MRTSVLLLAACAVGSALVVTTGAGGAEQATTVRLTAALNAAQEVPRPSGNVRAARGTFTATAAASGTGAVLRWRLTFARLSGPATAAHIHIASRGRAGPVAVPLCGPCRSRANGRATVDRSVRRAIAAGRAYVNVHTAVNEAGEIRGQIGVRAAARITLDARQEVPRPRGAVARARGVFAVTVTRTGRTAVISWRLTFRRLTGRATSAHVHIGARGRAGRVAIPLCGPCRSGAHGQATARGAALRALEQGRAYVNVHTARNPAGEIRGQIRALALTLTGSGDPGSGGGGGGGGGGEDPPPYPPPGDPYP